MDMRQVLAVLDDWQARMREAEAQHEALRAVVGCNPEGPLQTAISRLQGALTEQVAARCRISVAWLETWWLECDLGAKPLHAGLVGEPLRTITSLAALLALITDDDALADAGAGD